MTAVEAGFETPGAFLVGLAGTELEPDDRKMLSCPAVSGAVLFTRNFRSKQQLIKLVAEIRCVDSRLLLAVDQEGGPVQRFREDFTPLPALRKIGICFASDADAGLSLAYAHATVMASELRQCGIDMSFAPVLDLYSDSRVIGQRAFAAEADVVIRLGRAYVQGMNDSGMVATLKHFPGHGSVTGDTHTECPEDRRDAETVMAVDGRPFAELLECDRIAVMLSHVRYPRVDGRAADFSSYWINSMLRERLGFTGCVISDDLGMQAAGQESDIMARAGSAFDAGCDLALVCDPGQARECVSRWSGPGDSRIAEMLRAQPALRQADLAAMRNKLRNLEHLARTST